MQSVIDTEDEGVRSAVDAFDNTTLSTEQSVIVGVVDTGERYRIHVVYSVYNTGLPDAIFVGDKNFVSMSVEQHESSVSVIYETVK
jgi:hypothetical protein